MARGQLPTFVKAHPPALRAWIIILDLHGDDSADAREAVDHHGITFGVIFQNQRSATSFCRRPIKMSPLCQLEMTLPQRFPGGVWGDGLADERRGADAAGGAARSGSEAIDDAGGGTAAAARAALAPLAAAGDHRNAPRSAATP